MATGTLAASPANTRVSNGTGTKTMERLAVEEAGLSLEVNDAALNLANEFLAILVRQAKQRPDYSTVMLEELTEKEFEQNTKVVEEKLAKWSRHLGINQPVGAVVGGTGPLREPFEGVTGEQAQQAVQILKACGRLVQCGRGRGKCLVVMSNRPVDESVLGVKAVVGGRTVKPAAKPAVKAAKAAKSQRKRSEQPVATQTTVGEVAAPPDRVMDSLRKVIEVVTDLTEHLPVERQELEAQLAAARAEADPGRLSQLMADKRMLERQLAEYQSLLEQREATIKALEVELAEKQLTSWS